MKSFQHVISELRLFQGPDCLQRLPRELDRLGCSRAMIFCGASLAGSPTFELLRQSLGGHFAGAFTEVRAHSPCQSVEAGARAVQQYEADAAVALGGGSAIVTARAASILAAEPGKLEELSTSTGPDGRMHSPKLLAPKIPQIVLPTTPTSACVKAGTAVSDPEQGRRYALFDPKTRAQAIFVHPELLMSAPRALVVSAALDSLSLAIEGLASAVGDPISDALLMHAIRMLAANLVPAASGDDPSTRADLLVGAVLCGRGTDHTGGGVATVLGHAIGAACKTENGLTKAVVLPKAIDFNAEAAVSGLIKTATALGLQICDSDAPAPAVIGALKALFSELGLPARLRDLEVPRESLAEISERAMEDWFLRGNPRKVREPAELLKIMEEAW